MTRAAANIGLDEATLEPHPLNSLRCSPPHKQPQGRKDDKHFFTNELN